MNLYNKVIKSSGIISGTIRDINSASSSKRVAGDKGRYLTNTLLKRRRGLALSDKDVRYRDNNKLLQC